MLIKPSSFYNPKQFSTLYNLNNLKLKTVFSVFVPRRLKMWAMMMAFPQTRTMCAEPFACVGSAPNVKLVVDYVAYLIDDRLLHGFSVSNLRNSNVTPNTRCVSTGKEKARRSGL
jgi:hypothetical protein